MLLRASHDRERGQAQNDEMAAPKAELNRCEIGLSSRDGRLAAWPTGKITAAPIRRIGRP